MSKREAVEGNRPELLNSSFYSSSSINTLDHAKNFRNSLILRELSDQSFTTSLQSESLRDEENVANSAKLPAHLAREEETATMKMSTSPSLSALASILNEKIKRTQASVKKNDSTENFIIEEVDEYLPNTQAGIDKVVVSPNLIDVDDTNNVHFPDALTTVEGLISEQPDFLSSPRRVEYDSHLIADTSQENDNITSKKYEPETLVPHKDVGKNREDLAVPKRRSVSAEPTLGEAAPTRTNTTVTNKRRSNLFSFLRKRSSGENNLKENPTTQGAQTAIPNSTSFSTGSAISSPPQSTKITKKSYSSSNIFSTFRKNKDYKKEHDGSIRSVSAKVPYHEESNTSAASAHKHDKTRASKRWSQSIQTEKKGRKATPLSFDHLAVNDLPDKLALPKLPEPAQPAEKSIRETEPLSDGKIDTGEVLFPKSLSKLEVDSIVSLERSRSTKSNKRSSIASHRRSLTDTLSINAQNEGMFITEAGSVVISTPDLSKSPTNSILRNGRFEPIDFSSNTSVFLGDQVDIPIMENIDIGSGIDLSATRNSFSMDSVFQEDRVEPPLMETLDVGGSLDISGNRNSFSMDSIGEKLNDFTLESEDDIKHNGDSTKRSLKKEIGDDPELMSDIMEFASLINFGEGINLEIDDSTTKIPYKSVRPIHNSGPSSHDMLEEDSMHLSLSQIGSERDGLGISFDEGNGESGIPQNIISDSSSHIYEGGYANAHEEDDFENENFNEIHRSPESTPKLRQFIPESQIARPISMSFRGLKAPSLNTSMMDSSNAESLSKKRVSNSWSPENVVAHCVNFSSRIILFDTYSEDEYDRKPDIATCNQLTPQLARLIKAELNELKFEMNVHEESRCYTHFY